MLLVSRFTYFHENVTSRTFFLILFPHIISAIFQQIWKMPLILALFILVAITAGSGANTLAQGRPGLHGPPHINRAENEYLYIESELQPFPAEVQNSIGATLQSRSSDQRILTNESEHVSLHTEIQDGSDGVLFQPHVTLVIAVPSIRPDRRKAIRETWAKWADDRVVLRFFTEPPNQGIGDESVEEIAARLGEESLTYGDVVLQDIGTGMNFGLKLLSAMKWMSDHYSFDFFLRLDDDYFLCLERLLEDLGCLILPEKQSIPIFTGYRICYQDRNATYMDEAYMLFSSSIIDRILAVSDLKCSRYGSFTAAAWMRVGGPGNPGGDVAVVNDYRLDHFGYWWRNAKRMEVTRAEYSPICKRVLGIHRAYPERMRNIWMEVSSRPNKTKSIVGCKSMFRYEEDGECPPLSNSAEEYFLQKDRFQPCESFSVHNNNMWCGHEGC